VSRLTQRALQRAEETLYIGVGLLLVTSALIVLGNAAYKLATDVEDGVREAIEAMLDALLVTFILVELLSAVRATLAERQLVAEPFILVGIIATIKELVVLAAFGAEELKPEDLALELGTLAGVLLALAVAAWLVRRKEREPEESDDSDAEGAAANR
jgi:uncharacterized membrane protein (DUF373 family)